jgi:NADPH:quinone reductase-like Zn-dependent oxidoreductase
LLKSLRQGGKLVAIPSPTEIPSQDLLDEVGVTATRLLVEPDYAALEEIASMMANGKLEVLVGETRPLEQIGELHAIGERGGPFGKLVATID